MIFGFCDHRWIEWCPQNWWKAKRTFQNVQAFTYMHSFLLFEAEKRTISPKFVTLDNSKIFQRTKTVHIFATAYWAAKQQTSWVIAPWWFSVSPWRICITFVWPRGSLKLTAPSSRSNFETIRLCLALLFIISIDANCRWHSDWLNGAVSFRELLGQTKVMQIRQGETLNH